MPIHGWQNVEQAHLLQKVILLHLLNKNPEGPSVTNLSEWKSRQDDSHERILDPQREKELAESFTFLAATTDDPKKVVAACVEEGEDQACLTVRLAVNNGNLSPVIAGFERMAKIFERVARTVRLRSRHAKRQCNFKKEKMQQAKIIPQLYEAINGQTLAQTSGVTPLLFTALKADVEKLHALFANLENLTASKVKSKSGLDLIVQMVITCQQVHDRRILHQVLTESSRLDPSSRASIAQKITKLSRYSSVSRFLLQAARKYPVFKRVRISAVCFRAPNLPATELDAKTVNLIQGLLDKPKLCKLASKFDGSPSFAIENHIRQGATLPVPVHAESNQSKISARGSSASQRPPFYQDPISASKIDTTSRIDMPIPCTEKTAPATVTESRIEALSSRSEASSTATAICAPLPSHALSEERVIPSGESTDPDNLHVSLKKGHPIWREISSSSHSFHARTPQIRLTISKDELLGHHHHHQRTRETSHDPVAAAAGCGHYWVILEYLSDYGGSSVAQGEEDVPLVNVLDLPTQDEMVLDYGTAAEWPRGLRVCGNDDVISITYSSRKPDR
ncbi:MAG: hypothetical protein Q9185_003763 [Variospora sp. 1 TL-2023]